MRKLEKDREIRKVEKQLERQRNTKVDEDKIDAKRGSRTTCAQLRTMAKSVTVSDKQ